MPLNRWRTLRDALAAGEDYLHQVIQEHAPTQLSLEALIRDLAEAIETHRSRVA